MKIFQFVSMFALLVALCVACKKDDSTPDQNGPLPDTYAQRLNVVFDSMCKVMNLKGASAALIIPNKGTWNQAFGESHSGVPIKTDMTFTIGSNTKTYISTLMLKLQEQGKLSMNDTIGKWIKDKPFTNGQVTIRQLLNQTSGFGDFTYNPAYIEAIKSDFNRVWYPEEMFQFFQEPYFTLPGSAYAYSDQNLLLAGLIIEAVTGKRVEKSMREYILEPAKLPYTVYYPFETSPLTFPHSWSADYSPDGTLIDLDASFGYNRIAFCSADNAAGGMASTAVENAQFWDKLMTGKIINQNSLSQMKTFVETGLPNFRYGLCLQESKNRFNGRTIYSHNGYVPGSINDNAYDPISGVCITILTNQDNILDFAPILGALHKVTLDYK